MNAQILTTLGPIDQTPLQLVELPTPEPTGRQLRVKVTVCGVCHTEIDEIEGRLVPKLPIVLGHQIVGRVDKRGPDAAAFATGDRVGIAWINASCGACRFCRAGLENLCHDALWTGKDVDGGYAEYALVSEEFAYPVPDVYTDLNAAPLLCAGIIGYRALRLAGLTERGTLALYGFGASAHLVLQVAKHLHPDCRVLVFTRGEHHRRLARRLGADWTGTLADSPPTRPTCAIDFTPVGQTIREALRMLDRGGRLVVNAIRKETSVPELDYALHLWDEKELKSVANVTRQDALEFLPLAASIPIVSEVEEFGLADASRALQLLKAGDIKGAAALRVSG